MKKITFFITIVFIFNLSTKLNAQDTFSGKITYKCFFPDKKQRNKSTLQPLFINSFKSLQISSNNTSNSTGVKKEEVGVSLTLPYGDSIGRQIYRNIKDSILITRRPKNAISEPFIVKEKWVNINWKIENKTKKIGGYLATKAKGSFRGREYTVWFTYEIPIPFGPWKLHGLPGLILEAEDSEKMMRFYATEIKIPFETKDALKVPKAENEITHQEEVYMRDNFDKILAKKMNARLPKGSSITPRTNNDGRKYWGEKVFEWETDAVNDKKN